MTEGIAVPSTGHMLGSMLVAALLGGIIGLEREVRGKSAGFRTNMLICVGSALVTEMSIRIAAMAPGVGDPGRIASYVMSGIGFLGAGVIWQARGEVSGMTTAATIWMIAAIGITVGAGERLVASAAALFVLLTLAALRKLEEGLDDRPHRRTLRVEMRHQQHPGAPEISRRALEILEEEGFHPEFIEASHEGDGGTLVFCRIRIGENRLPDLLLRLMDRGEVAGVRAIPR